MYIQAAQEIRSAVSSALRRLGMAVSLAVAIGLGGPAQAMPITLNYAGTSAASGDFAAVLLIDIPSFGAAATDVSGNRNGVAITGLSPYASADNTVQSTGPYVSFSGLSFQTSDGTAYNLYYNGSQLYEINNILNPGGFASMDAPVAEANIVEPVSILLLGSGLVATGLLRRRYSKR